VKAAEATILAAREGVNASCIDCGGNPLWGGLRCLTCFQRRADERSNGIHGCPRHDPSSVCYNQCACRCEKCSEIEKARR
jgi:hypothetical protein